MWPWCVMMVLKVVTGRGKRTLKIYSPERPLDVDIFALLALHYKVSPDFLVHLYFPFL